MIKETVLIEEHHRCGAKFISFHGWKLPLEFSSSREEHLNVRKNVGLFDVSHMGEIRVKGPGALKFLERHLTNNVADLGANQTQYNLLCNEQGGILDDLILYCLKPSEDYLLCVNAARLEADLKWFHRASVTGFKEFLQKKNELKSFPLTTDSVAKKKEENVSELKEEREDKWSSYSLDKVVIQNESDQWAQLALQGPKAPSLLAAVLKDKTVLDIGKNHFQWLFFAEESILVSATGYTGEKGFEILISPGKASCLWREILNQGKSRGCLPVGLAARDTLRMEMKYPLYGKDLNEKMDPHSAGLSWAVKNPTDFIGSAALSKIKKQLKNKWVGFQLFQDELASRPIGIPRSGSRILVEGKPVGEVTSGARSPALNRVIGLGYVPVDYSSLSQLIQVEIHQKPVPAEIVSTPFIALNSV